MEKLRSYLDFHVIRFYFQYIFNRILIDLYTISRMSLVTVRLSELWFRTYYIANHCVRNFCLIDWRFDLSRGITDTLEPFELKSHRVREVSIFPYSFNTWYTKDTPNLLN